MSPFLEEEEEESEKKKEKNPPNRLDLVTYC